MNTFYISPDMTFQDVAVPVLLMRDLEERSVDPQAGKIYLSPTVMNSKKPCILA